ncbi:MULTISPECIES: SDR family oxidoreductase [Mycobacterium]|uniref:3-alpha-hydroxysteroid dehydrogenase n=1 Tax=Mycobacterium kiyosense TaxID=2871094 RepID=A0A9P3Q3Y2_9MYCO|nr:MULTISPECIES: SDR family oxidoreductase [Mycobacterium]BDB44134.1 3-alpha-hydroxysteroid dehydrogenase [Mycobacterium kiyosense]BDE15666.1 3-alpha-hydroxysteroid dehydrogenase [Mycobacterium sp. 20KCMC460]GLB80911.1 3-alpha-hydroxysteroid dehydrogenase [Mycobacterium kiyosense]GLB87329.1 3-alpha-hydroxysteroid dehydrogenase [Mycobacterium kiyosense]GLB93391.1 3-alpha-hydroxysteroid dehydrogenase [Mycobacterium kiyosense]
MPDDARTLVQGAARIIDAGLGNSVAGRSPESRTWQRLSGRTALVVGAARGMGEATARLFHAEGANVVLGDVLDEQGELVAKDLGEGASFVHLDVTSESDWARAHEVAESEFGAPVSAYAHTAAVASFSFIADLSLEDYRSIIEIDQVGVFLGMKSCIEPMTRAGGGAMVAVSSVDGIGAHPGLAGYTSAKFAIRGLVRVAALELARNGIRVNTIVPGGIDTPMIRPRDVEPEVLDPLARQVPLGHVGDPAELARAALWLVSDESSYVTGTDLIVDGGLMARVPLDLE